MSTLGFPGRGQLYDTFCASHVPDFWDALWDPQQQQATVAAVTSELSSSTRQPRAASAGVAKAVAAHRGVTRVTFTVTDPEDSTIDNSEPLSATCGAAASSSSALIATQHSTGTSDSVHTRPRVEGHDASARTHIPNHPRKRIQHMKGDF